MENKFIIFFCSINKQFLTGDLSIPLPNGRVAAIAANILEKEKKDFRSCYVII